MVVRTPGRGGLDRLPDLRVQGAAQPERQAFVRPVSDQGMAEADVAGFVRAEELAQPAPGFRVRRFAVEHRHEQIGRERPSEHRRAPQDVAIGRGEPVDPRHDQRFDGVGQRRDVGRARGREQLLQEERVPTGALRQRRQLIGAERRVLRRGRQHLGGGFRVQRLQIDAGAVIIRTRGESLADVPAGHANEPRRCRQVLREVTQEVRRRLVEPMNVFEDEDRGGSQQPDHHRPNRVVQPRPPEPIFERGRLRRLGNGCVDRDRDERFPREEVWAQRGEHFVQALGNLVGPGVGGDTDDGAKQTAERPIRRGRLVELARGDERHRVLGVLADLVDQTRLAESGLADDLDETARPGSRVVELTLEHRELHVAAQERHVRLLDGVPGTDDRSDIHRVIDSVHQYQQRRSSLPCFKFFFSEHRAHSEYDDSLRRLSVRD